MRDFSYLQRRHTRTHMPTLALIYGQSGSPIFLHYSSNVRAAEEEPTYDDDIVSTRQNFLNNILRLPSWKKDPSHLLLPTLVTFMSWNCWFGWVWLDNCSCNDASFCCKGHIWDIWIGVYKARKKREKKSAMSIVWRTKVPSSPIDTMGKWQKIPISRERLVWVSHGWPDCRKKDQKCRV